MSDPDARATARQHTAQLLKMLRGYGPVPTPEPAATASKPSVEPTGTVIAEAPSAYVCLREAAPSPPPLPPLQPAHSPRPSAQVRLEAKSTPGCIPTVGEKLRCCPSSGVLGQMVARADSLNRLRQIFRAYLPPHLHDHAVLIRLDQEIWEVHADSASWATRLRYALPNIRPLLSQHLGIDVPKPRIRVAPIAAPPQPRWSRLTLTKRNAELLEAAARNLPDARLGAALLRLAANARPTAEAATKK